MNAIEKHCAEFGGYVVSEGTLRPQDLIPKYLDALRELAPAAYQQCMMPGCGFPMVPSYALEDESAEWWDNDAHYVMEQLSDALSEYAPEGYYFGANEGDGACIGFFANIEPGILLVYCSDCGALEGHPHRNWCSRTS